MTSVKGLSDFRRRWKAIPRNIKQVVRAELEKIADSIVEDMRRAAPKASGAGAASIDWTWHNPPQGALALGTVAENQYQNTETRITIYAAAGDEFYMRFQEFGTEKMSANPFFYPIWRARRRSVRSKITRSISKAIKSS